MKKTCVTCVRGNLSSYLYLCVECLKKDKPGNRFPNWEKKEVKDENNLD